MHIDTSMQGRPFYLRTTDENGVETFSEHTVWDGERFLSARQADARKLNKDKDSTKASAAQITRDQFKARKAS